MNKNLGGNAFTHSPPKTEAFTEPQHMPQNTDDLPPKSSPDFTLFSDQYPPSVYDEAFWQYGVDITGLE